MIAQPRSNTTPACAACGINFPPRSAFTEWAVGVLRARCELALNDPAGEFDRIVDLPAHFDWPTQTWGPTRVEWAPGAAVALGGVKARAILLHLAERLPAQPVNPRRDLDPRDLLDRLGCDPSQDHGVCRCPAHEDRSASLSWRWTGERALLHCFAGCTFDEIRGAI